MSQRNLELIKALAATKLNRLLREGASPTAKKYKSGNRMKGNRFGLPKNLRKWAAWNTPQKRSKAVNTYVSRRLQHFGMMPYKKMAAINAWNSLPANYRREIINENIFANLANNFNNRSSYIKRR